jgi:CheY-like chemotaxis protein
VVEDDVDLRAVLRAALEQEGFAVETAGDGLSALQKVRQLAPDLVILDLNMSRMGGEEFLYAWRTGGETPGVPVIVITAVSRALRPRDLGVEAFFPKPFEIDTLLQRARELVSTSPGVDAAGRDNLRAEMIGVSHDLADAMSVVVSTAELLAVIRDLPDELQTIPTMNLEASQRAAALARRLKHLITTLK